MEVCLSGAFGTPRDCAVLSNQIISLVHGDLNKSFFCLPFQLCMVAKAMGRHTWAYSRVLWRIREVHFGLRVFVGEGSWRNFPPHTTPPKGQMIPRYFKHFSSPSSERYVQSKWSEFELLMWDSTLVQLAQVVAFVKLSDVRHKWKMFSASWWHRLMVVVVPKG